MKKILSLVLSLAMLLTMAALPVFAEEEPVVLNVFYATSRPMNDATDLTREYIKEQIGVDINLTQGDGANFAQQLALYIADGNMPDVVRLDYDMWKEYAVEGAWADLTDYVTDECTDLNNYVGDYWTYAKQDDRIFGVPSLSGTPSNHVIAIRQDWLTKLGLEVPATLDDFINVMRAFTTQDPDGNGKNDTYGLGGTSASTLSPIFGAYGATTDESFFLNDDGTITTNAISEAYKQGLKIARDLYAEGLIDPEVFTCSNDQMLNKWCRGEMGIMSAAWSRAGNAYLRYDFGTLQPNAEVKIILPPTGPEGLSNSLPASPLSAMLAVSYQATPEKIEAAMKLFNFASSPFGWRVTMYGVPGEFFDYDEATEQTLWTSDLNNGVSKSGKYEVTDMQVYKLFNHAGWEAQGDGLIEAPHGQMWKAGSAMRFEENVKPNVFAMFRTEEYTELFGEVDTYFRTSMLAFVMGEKDIDAEWDNYVQTYLTMGGDAIRQSQLVEYNKAFGTNCTFAE